MPGANEPGMFTDRDGGSEWGRGADVVSGGGDRDGGGGDLSLTLALSRW